MSEFESALIIILVLLVIFVGWIMYTNRSWNCSPDNLTGAEWFSSKKDDLGLSEHQELNLLEENDYQELLNQSAVDSSTRESHKAYVAESLGKVAGASKASVFDHDLDSNWVGLRRPKNITPTDNALQQYSAQDSDYTKGTNLRWN